MSTLRHNFRSLSWKLCEQRDVPLLVTDMIADYLVHRDLFKINTLSRSLNEQANAVIYRDIVVNLDGDEQSITIASLLFRTLLTSKTAAQAVRTLSLAGDPLQDWRNKIVVQRRTEWTEWLLEDVIPPAMHADLANFTEEEIKLYQRVAAPSPASTPPISEVSVWKLYLHAFCFAPQIRDFTVSSDYFRFTGFRNTLQDMARGSSMQKLRSCSLCLDLLRRKCRHPSVAQHWNSALLALFAVPGIESIATVASLLPEAVRQLRPGGSSVTRLTLHHYQCGESDLNSLLAATPNLRYLKYHAVTDWGWQSAIRDGERLEHGVGFEPLYNALHHVSDSLQELHMSQEFDEDSFHFNQGHASEEEPPFRQREELSDLKRLHTLTIPFATLLGWKCKDCVWDWDKTLPSSLRRIIWTDDLQASCFGECWDDQNLMPVISGLVGWLSSSQRGNEAAEFGLHLDILGSDFNEPVRQQLLRMCEESGVRCSIEKARADCPRPNGWTPSVAGRKDLIRGRGRGRGRVRGT